MKLHRRFDIVNDAELELSGFLIGWQKKHDLTYGELFKILSLQIANYAKYAIRGERHPDDPDKKGDEE